MGRTCNKTAAMKLIAAPHTAFCIARGYYGMDVVSKGQSLEEMLPEIGTRNPITGTTNSRRIH
jgi:hypothetical protein